MELKNKVLFLIIPIFLFSFPLNQKLYKKLKTGDLIFRREDNSLSFLFAKINSSYYSHSGIIFFKGNVPYVIHVEGGFETNDLHIVTLKQYLKNAIAFKIMRLKEKIDKKSFFQLLQKIKKTNIEFDYDFDLKNIKKNKFYCTDFVNYFYYNLLKVNLYKHLSLIKNHKVILVKDLIKSSYLKYVLEEK